MRTLLDRGESPVDMSGAMSADIGGADDATLNSMRTELAKHRRRVFAEWVSMLSPGDALFRILDRAVQVPVKTLDTSCFGEWNLYSGLTPYL